MGWEVCVRGRVTCFSMGSCLLIFFFHSLSHVSLMSTGGMNGPCLHVVTVLREEPEGTVMHYEDGMSSH